MFIDSFLLILPLIVVAVAGYLTTPIFKVDVESLVRIVADFFIPMFIIQAVYTTDMHAKMFVQMGMAISLVVILSLGVSYLYTHLTKIESRDFVPGASFMNSGFLGIPLMASWGGISAMNLVIIYDQFLTLYLMTIGVLIMSGGLTKQSFKNIASSPILWALVFAFIYKYLDLPMHKSILETLEFGSSAVGPVSAYILGSSLRGKKVKIDFHILAAVVIRLGGGLVFGLIAVTILKIEGLLKDVIIIASALPAAVFTSVLPIRYKVPSKNSSAIVMVSTLASAITIPLVLMMLK